MKIVVTGSLGHISKPLTRELVEKDHIVTVISSKEEKQKHIKGLGATAAIGSLENADFLTSTFTGADAVYCMIPLNFSELNQVAYYQRIGRAYAQAIQKSKVNVWYILAVGEPTGTRAQALFLAHIRWK
ncbi:NAD(P)H-binding protein [Cnuella takakiae]|uniref:NAD(P)H-binding protein n=1 Tax=Cnuella takakiae TaxID=1302690 RepID=UPI001FE664C7|nr:NAD(P)H-binding protein [Cnuella takakiae]